MNSTELATALVQGAFLALTVLALAALFRARDKLRLEIALFFCALVLVVLALAAERRSLPEGLRLLKVFAALTEPFIILLLMQSIQPARAWLTWSAGGVMIVLGLLLLALPSPRPSWFIAAGALYYVSCNMYAGLLMAQLARRTRGITHWRFVCVSIGALALAGLSILAAWYLIVLSTGPDPFTKLVGIGLLLLIGITFYLGWLAPRVLLQFWEQLERYDFFVALAREPGVERGPVALEQLTRIARQLVGVTRVLIATRSEGKGIWEAAADADVPLPVDIFQRAIETRAAQFITSRQTTGQAGAPAADALGACARVVIPIVPAHAAARCLVLCLRFRSWFIEDDVALLKNLSVAAGVALDHTELIETQRAQEENFRNLLETAPDAIIIVDARGEIVLANAQAEKLFGYARQELMAEPIEILLPEDARARHLMHRAAYFRQPLLRPMGAGLELRARHRDGSEFPAEISLSPLETSQGLVVSATIRDITERKRVEAQIRLQTIELEQRVQARTADLQSANLQLNAEIVERERAEQALRTSEAHFRALLEHSFDAVSLFDAAGKILYTTPGTTQVLGYVDEEYVGHSIFEYIHPNDLSTAQNALASALDKPGELVSIEFRMRHKNGEWLWIEGVCSNLLDQPDVRAIVSNYRDLTERKFAQQELESVNAKLFSQVRELRGINHELMLLNVMGEALQACENTAEVLQTVEYYLPQLFPRARGAVGLRGELRNSLDWVVQWGKRPVVSETVSSVSACWAMRSGRMLFVGDTARAVVCQHLSELLPAAYICIPLTGQGQSLGVLHLAFDSTAGMGERHQQLARNVADEMELTLANLQLRESLREQSIRDPLTNLYNRRYLQEVLNQELSKAQRASQTLGVAMIDLDHFKQFNDSFGHDAGDDVLRTLAQALAQHVRREDTLSRYGGEEFVVVIPNPTREILLHRAEQWRASVQAIRLFHRGTALPALSISLGLAFYPENGVTADELLRAADLALYRAKDRGRDRVVIAGAG